MPLFTLAAELQSSEQPFGHTVLASQPVSRALGLSSLRQESPLLSSPPALHLRASPLPVKSLPLIEFSLLFILLSALFLSHCYPPLHPLSWAHLLPFLYCYRHQHFFFFFFGISESKHFLHIKMWNSFWHWAENRVEPAVWPYLFLSHSVSLSLFSTPYYVSFFLFPHLQSMNPRSHLTFLNHLESILHGKDLFAPIIFS